MSVPVAPADVRAAIVAALQAALPSGIDIAAHGGNFNEAELQRFSLRAPAIRVCITGIGKIGYAVTGQIEMTLHLAVVIVARDQAAAGAPTLDRDAAALNLVALVMPALNGQVFGLDDVSAPIGLEARNEYSGGLDKTGIALWQITGDIMVRTGVSVFDETGALTGLIVAGVPFAGTVNGTVVAPGAALDLAASLGVPGVVAANQPVEVAP